MILKNQLVNDIVKSKCIPITEFSYKLDQSTKFKPRNQFKALVVTNSLYDVIFHSRWISSPQSHPTPNSSGFMQQIVYKNEVELWQSDVFLLQNIDVPPTELTCIYSKPLFIQYPASEMNISVPCIIFGQQL